MVGMKWNEHMSHLWAPVGLGSEKSHLSRGGGWVPLRPTRQQCSEVNSSASRWPVECSPWKLAHLPVHVTPERNSEPFNSPVLSLQSEASKVIEGLMKKSLDLPP